MIAIGFTYNSFAQDDTKDVNTIPTDTIQPGVQGSINPMNANKPVITGDDLLDDSFPNSWPLFGSDIRMRIGGYVKADFIHDFDYVGNRYEFETGSIAVEGTPERELGGITTFHAKESRVNFDFRSKAKWNNGKEFPMQIFVEFDWFFDSDTFRFSTRLRQAYGVIGSVLIGRSWNTSSDLSAITSLIDFAGGDAFYGGRVTQIRWMDNISDSFSYAVAIEDPGGQIDNPLDVEGAFRPLWPNLGSMIKYKAKNGSTVQLGLDLFPLSWKGPDTVPNDTELGYALTVMSRLVFNVTEYNDALTWGGGFGKGQGHKILALSWDGKASGVVDNNNLTLAPSWLAYVGYNHYWSKNLNSTIATHWVGTKLSTVQSPNTFNNAATAHVNLVYFPYKRISTGIEYMWGKRENFDGTQGKANRIQFMAKFVFN